MIHKAGDLVRSINVDPFPVGGKKKRSGYTTLLGTMPNGAAVQDLATWQRASGTQFWNYSLAGGVLYYSTQGTGAWTNVGNGTLSANGTLTTAIVNHAYKGDMYFVSDGVSNLYYSTTGTSLVNNGTSLITGFLNGTNDGTVGSVTTATPTTAVSLVEYQQRLYAAGGSSFLNFSNVGYQDDWTNNSTSIVVPGPGKIISIYKSNDRLIITKNSGAMYRYDGNTLIDLVTNLGPTSSRSQGNIEDSQIYLNQSGFFAYAGNKPQIISNPIDRQVFNDPGSGIIGTSFFNSPGETFNYTYYCSVGTVTDDLTSETISNAIEVYDYKHNEWTNYQFAHRPVAWLPYTDNTSNDQFMFASGSQCYQLSGTATSDAGQPITTVIQGVLHFDSQESEKIFNYMWVSFNPGAQAKVQVAISDTYTKEKLNWIDMGDVSDGVAELIFPEGSRGRLLMYRVTETSATDRFTLYGFTVDVSTIDRK